MKRTLAFFLCISLLCSVFALPCTVATAATDRDGLAQEIIKDIENLGEITQDSITELVLLDKKIWNFGYQYGTDQYFYITNYADFTAAIEQYNALQKVDCTFGDVNDDTLVDAKDALAILRVSVGKQTVDHWHGYLADVNVDGVVNATDALMVLQYTVKKRESFAADETLTTPFAQSDCLYSVKTSELYKTTYQSMIDRTTEEGYAQTSLTGAYEGMFCRDSAIQIMAHMAEGDYEQARLILDFITQYHIENRYPYVLHIIYPGMFTYPSAVPQTDTTFFFLHAWVQFATTAPQTAKNKAYIEGSLEKVKEFANYYLNVGDLDIQYDLFLNWNFEHTRNTSYWESYDLLTNVYASQALHEMAEYFKTSDPTNANRWQTAADRIVKGVHENLTVELDGALMYAELRGRSHKAVNEDMDAPEQFIAGFSWVNLAPMGCDWYGADPEILEHTYQMYLTYGACRYYRNKTDNDYTMLEACTTFSLTNPRPIRTGNHIIGKGLAWEMMYCAKTGKTQRLETLASFVEEFCDTMYRETWVYAGGGADTGNQEQASWLLIANKTAFPKLKH